MWIIVAVILIFLLSFSMCNAGKGGHSSGGNNSKWTEEDDWAQLDEDLDD